MPSSSRTINLLILVCFLTTAAAKFYPFTYYLDQYCGTTIYVSQEIRVRLSQQTYLYPNKECGMTFRPSAGNKLVATFLNYSMPSDYVDASGICNYESIQLTQESALYFGYRGYCGWTKPNGQYDLHDYTTFSFQVWQNMYVNTAQVDLLITEVFNKDYQNSCPYNTFDCQRSGICIDQDLTCNGYDDCGNNLDETLGCRTPSLDVKPYLGAIIGGSAGLVVLVVVIVVTVVVCRRRGGKSAYIQI
ncbi:unnamed protein product [Lymnaea stagnalis]|uniref:CUB domain-containing protein n=1 Tax=Lymnaea stagnalis TaxID=6523 RepID=A0AAV2HKL2_LYMST